MRTPRINILIVDDDEEDRRLLQEVLAQVISQFEVSFSCDGVDCIRQLKNGLDPDLVFIDLNMPLKNGIECLRDFQLENLLPDTPVIIYSTSYLLKDINAASEYGARFYMVKPTTLEALKNMIDRVIHLLGRPLSEQLSRMNFVVREKGIEVIK